MNQLPNSENKKNEPNNKQPVQLLEDEDDEELIAMAAPEIVKVSVAMDGGAVDNVIGPDELPAGTTPSGNTTGKHFVGASGERIHKYGHCSTMLVGAKGEVGCKWQVADVTRPLHAVSRITGPEEGPGLQDVLFNNKRCVVVPPGVVDKILKEVNAVAEYERRGGLYVADMQMSGFPRQGAAL